MQSTITFHVFKLQRCLIAKKKLWYGFDHPQPSVLKQQKQHTTEV